MPKGYDNVYANVDEKILLLWFILVTTLPLVTVLTLNDVVVHRDPDAPLGK